VASGILNVNKPAGPSSFAIVRTVRRLPGVTKVGHGGTLDPAADGVLPVLVNAATRLADFIHEWPKTYRASVKFGFTSDTGDREGTIMAAGDAGNLSREQIEQALPAFIGRIEQRPPAFSALKQGGEAMYRKARRGEAVDRRPRPVVVDALRLLDFDSASATARLEVRSGRGMYVRSLAEDLGAALGCGAYLQGLTRTDVGPLALTGSITPASLQEAGDAWTSFLLPMDLPIRTWPAIALDAGAAEAVRQGQSVAAPKDAAGRFRMLDPEGRLLAWGEVDVRRQRLQPRAVFSS
jgi:tRNA pseudouridine55 synthase